MRRASVIVLVLLAAGCVAPEASVEPEAPVAPEAPAPGYVPNVLLLEAPRPPSATVHDGAEPMVLTDRDGEWIWIGSTGGAARSRDNGTTWETLDWPFLLSADGWAFAQDEVGRLYVTTTGVPYVEVYRSDDDGASWIRPGLPARLPLTGVQDVSPVADRPWLAARGDGEVLLIFYDTKTVAEACLMSTDGAVTFPDRDPNAGSPNSGRPDFADDGRFAFTSTAGFLHVFDAPLATSRCQGLPRTTDMFSSKGIQTQVHTSSDGEAFYAAAPTADNRAIELAARAPGLPVKRVVVSPPELKVNAYATVSASDDSIAVAWYGTETAGDWNSPGFNGSWNVFVAVVEDFWSATPTVTLTRVTTEPNHVGDICTGGISCTGASDRDLLDYFGIEHDVHGGIHVAYAHDGSGNDAEVRHARLG